MRSSSDPDDDPNRRDVGDRASVKEVEKKAKLRLARKENGLKQIMQSVDGRLWMWDFLSNAGLFSTVFNGNSKDYFNLGQRNAAMPIFADIQRICMDEYILMARENANVQT